MHTYQMQKLAEICFRQGITQFVISPGSRSAPITLALARHPGINVRMIIDERSAAFIALGIALKTKNPVGLVCTSGTAAYNYAPAIAEAFFQQIPLLLFTADRPPEWIDQQDGQTIRQSNLYGKHVKAFYELPSERAHQDVNWHFDRIINESIITSKDLPAGPVHINAPLREPLYPQKENKVELPPVQVIGKLQSESNLDAKSWQEVIDLWQQHQKILLVAGQYEFDSKLTDALTHFDQTPLVGDIISNLHPLATTIRRPDIILNHSHDNLKKDLQPDLLITFGKSIISKSLKLFLRKFKPKAHIHIQPFLPVADTYQSLSQIIPMHPASFFEHLHGQLNTHHISINANKDYNQLWQHLSEKAHQLIYQFAPQFNSEFEAVKRVMQFLPIDSCLCLANSMAIRYANFVALNQDQKYISVYANRGTSGIDGSSSTALGIALSTYRQVTLITGDLAFFYDRNAFWHQYPFSNLRVIVLNNHGGGIFRMIDGPAEQPELETYFETPHQLNAYHTASEMGFEYYHCKDILNLDSILEVFFEPEAKPKLLEIETDKKLNKEVFVQFKKEINKIYGT